MKQELEQKLINKYPWIFDMGGNIKNNGLMFGIQCDDGWYWLLDQLCGQIQKYIDDNDLPQVIASQIKEKYGTLSFYTYSSNDMVEGMIWLAQYMSSSICEACGCNHGKRMTMNGKEHGWVKTLCNQCAELDDYNYKEPLKNAR